MYCSPEKNPDRKSTANFYKGQVRSSIPVLSSMIYSEPSYQNIGKRM